MAENCPKHGVCGLCGKPDQDLWMLYIGDYSDWTCCECIQQIQKCQVRRFCSAGEETEPAE